MSLILAAAGRGSRLGELTMHTPKSLVVEPTTGRPLLSLMLEGLVRCGPLDHIAIVGSHDVERNRAMVRFVEEFPFLQKPHVHLVEGDARGVGYAFLLGAQRLLEYGVDDAICSVADSVAQTYAPVVNAEGAVLIGVTAPDPGSNKAFTSIFVSSDGSVLPECRTEHAQQRRIARGVYRFKSGALSEYVSIAQHGLIHRNGDPQVMNALGEVRVTWIWREMQQRGALVKAADLNSVAELNVPEDLKRFRCILPVAELPVPQEVCVPH